MSEAIFKGMENDDLKDYNRENIRELLQKIRELKDSNNFGDFDIDGKSDLSENEKIIKEQLSKTDYKVKFLEILLYKTNQIQGDKSLQNTSSQEVPTESQDIGPKLLNKKLEDYSDTEAKVGLKYLQDNYKNYKEGEEIDGKIKSNATINTIKDRHDAHLFQKELMNKLDPDLFALGFTDTHIRGFDSIKGESIISIKDFKTKLYNPNTKISGNRFDPNFISFIEMSRYIKYITFKEGISFDFDEKTEFNKEHLEILKKYLPEHLYENFVSDWRKQIKEYDYIQAEDMTNDEVKKGELQIFYNTLTPEHKELAILYLKDGYNFTEIKEVFEKKNLSLKTKMAEYEAKHKKYYEAEKQKIEEEKKQEENTKLKNTKSGSKITNTKSNNSDYYYSKENYIQTGNSFQIKLPSGGKISISEEEKDLTLGNPEATENLINFYMFFKELNLLGVWKYRKELMLAVGDIYINPNDGDSIKGEELRKFGNKLLTFISNTENEGKGEKVSLNSINSVNQELKKFSGANSMLSDGKTFNLRGEDKFTAYLRSQGIIGGAYFKTNKFRENIA